MSMGIATQLKTILSELADLYSGLDESRVEKLVEALLGEGRLFVAGAGRSGFLLRCFAMRLMHLGRPVHMVGEATSPGAKPGDMLLIGSGSGETGSLVSMAAKAKELGVDVLLVTTAPASAISRLADVVVVLPGPTPKSAGKVDSVASVQPMGSLFEQGMLLMLDAVVMRLMERMDIASEDMFKRHANLE